MLVNFVGGGADFDLLTALVSDVRKGKVFYGAGSKQPLTGALEEMPGQTIQPGTTLQTAGKILTGNISAAAATLKFAGGTTTIGAIVNDKASFTVGGLAFRPLAFSCTIASTPQSYLSPLCISLFIYNNTTGGIVIHPSNGALSTSYATALFGANSVIITIDPCYNIAPNTTTSYQVMGI